MRVRQATYTSMSETVPSGAITNTIPVHISQSRREFGLRPRLARMARTVGTSPNQFTEYVTIPIATPGPVAPGGNYDVGSTINYNGVTYTVVSILPELPAVA